MDGKRKRIEAQSNFLAIPEEGREQIYMRMPQNTALNLRATSKQIKQELDTYYPYNIKLDTLNGSEELMEQLITRRIKKCKLIAFNRSPPNLPVFKYPEYLKSLEINCNQQIDPLTFHTIMKECSQYLNQLHILISKDLCETFYRLIYRRFHYEYQSLRELTISSLDPSAFDNLTEHVNFISLRILKDVYSSLSELQAIDIPIIVDLASAHSKSVMKAIFSLIAKHRKTLKVIKIRIAIASFTLSKLQYSHFEKVDSENLLVELESLNLREVGLEFAEPVLENVELTDLFKQIVSASTSKTKAFTFKKMTKSTYQSLGLHDTIFKNKMNLKCVHLQFNFTVNMGAFKNCLTLHTLILIRVNINGTNDNKGEKEITNFTFLPKSIVKLYIKGFQIKTNEMSNFFRKDLKFLKSLAIIGSGERDKWGVDGFVFYKIFELPSILDIQLNPIDSDRNSEMFEACFKKDQFGSNILDVPPLFHIYRRKSINHRWRVFAD